MATSVVMPQMGESIAEGTIVRWMKRVGEPVDRDEPLFEISTDKVDAEIPAPAGGVLLAILAREGETVPVESVVGVIGAEGEEVGDVTGTAAAATSPPRCCRRTGASVSAAGCLASPRTRSTRAAGGSRRRSCGASRAIRA